MVKKIVFFPHSDNEFEDIYRLRSWLKNELKTFYDGVYYLKNPSGLGDIEKGSIVLFNKEGYCVGLGIIEKGLSETSEEEKSKVGEDYTKYVKFFPESIFVFNDNQLIKLDKITEITRKGFGQGYTIVDNLNQFLDILGLISD